MQVAEGVDLPPLVGKGVEELHFQESQTFKPPKRAFYPHLKAVYPQLSTSYPQETGGNSLIHAI